MINIAIDGPAGAGKSSIAKAVAAKYGYIYVDTGAMYRALAYKAITNKISIENTNDVENMLSSTKLDIKYNDLGQRIYLDGNDISDYIRTPEVSMGASDISAIPYVRQWLLDMQKNIAKANNCIMDGRDIGTTILPNADLKIFLTASAEERATRRYKELLEKGENVSFDEVLKDVETRDYNDSHRKVSPLKKADDAIEVDTTGYNLEESIKLVSDIIDGRMRGE